MKISLIKTTMFVSAICLSFASASYAQTGSLTERQLGLLDTAGDTWARSNYFSLPHSVQELQEFTNVVQFVLTNAVAQSNYFAHLHGGLNGLAYMSNAGAYMHPTSWPDSPEKQQALERASKLLSSAFDPKQVEWVCLNIATNFPEVRRFENQTSENGPIIITLITNKAVVHHVEELSGTIGTNFNYIAQLLTGSKVKTTLSGNGFMAEISDMKHVYYCYSWDKNGPLQRLEIRTPNKQDVIYGADFYPTGKLRAFRAGQSEGITFDAGGKLSSYWVEENNTTLDLRLDRKGNIVVRDFEKKQF